MVGLGAALGLDLKTLMELFSQTGANSRVLVTDGEDMMNRDHSCFFSAAHAAKDSGIALGLGKSKKLNLPLADATFKQYSKMVKLGLGGLEQTEKCQRQFPIRIAHLVKAEFAGHHPVPSGMIELCEIRKG